MPLERIYIVGTVASGKSFLAKKLSSILKIKHYDLDDIFWGSKFDEKREEKERDRLFKNLCRKKKWIIEGAYSTWIDYGIKKSDMVILLDTRIHVVLWRVIMRTIKREKSRQKGSSRYQENWGDLIGLIKAVLKYKKKGGYDRGYYKHKEVIEKHKVNFIHIKNKKQMNKFLKDISKKLA